jgi:hypothetical protein
VEINVPYEEATQCRQQIIDRMAPLDTVMDLVSTATRFRHQTPTCVTFVCRV